MKKEVVTQSGKVLSYEETFWLGKRTLHVDGVELTKKKKTTYTDGTNDYIVKGNQFFGLTIEIFNDNNKEVCVILEKLSIIGIILACIPLIMVFIGGAIGGALGALGFFLVIMTYRKTKNILLTALTSIIISGAIFGIWYLIAEAIGPIILY